MKYDDISINEIPELLAGGLISREKAIGLVAKDIQLNPRKYRIPLQSDDLRSEIIIRFIQNGDYIFDHYRNNHCDFLTYLRSFLHFQILTIHRSWQNLKILDKAYSQIKREDFENTSSNYEKDEYAYKIQHTTPYPAIRLEKTHLKKRMKSKGQPEQEQSFGDANMNKYFRNASNPKIKMALVLALKSSYFLNDGAIKKIGNFCKVPEQELRNAIDELNDSLESKTQKITKIEEKRDKEFFLHRKYEEILNNPIEYNIKGSKIEQIKHLYTYHTDSWVYKNELLQKRMRKICPTNRNIADVLGICERQVGYYIKTANKLFPETENNEDKETSRKLLEQISDLTKD